MPQRSNVNGSGGRNRATWKLANRCSLLGSGTIGCLTQGISQANRLAGRMGQSPRVAHHSCDHMQTSCSPSRRRAPVLGGSALPPGAQSAAWTHALGDIDIASNKEKEENVRSRSFTLLTAPSAPRRSPSFNLLTSCLPGITTQHYSELVHRPMSATSSKRKTL